jgi:hypothetical protein
LYQPSNLELVTGVSLTPGLQRSNQCNPGEVGSVIAQTDMGFVKMENYILYLVHSCFSCYSYAQ